MNAEEKTSGASTQPAPKPAAKRPRWAPPPPTPRSTMKLVAVIAGGTVLGIALVFGLHYILVHDTPIKPKLGDEFRDQVRDMADFAFSPPRKWNIDDRTTPYTYYVQGPKESGFSPLMIYASITAPGSIQAFLDEHKKRIEIEEPSTKFISEEEDAIDGCRVKRIEYDCDYKASDESPVVKLRTVQFIVKDPSFPVFYKITCHAKMETFASHLPLFEASAHSFRRVEIKGRIKYLPPGK